MAQLNSSLYTLKVRHQRLSPKQHRFEYNIFMFLLDLDELNSFNNLFRLCKVNRNGIYSFQNEDHLEPSPVSVRDKISSFLIENGISEEFIGKILLLTNLRVFGYVFNPVSIYFVHNLEGIPLCAVAEVGNTFLERKQYFLPVSHDNGKICFSGFAPKNFYVSPFSRVDDYFDFKVFYPDDHFEMSIDTNSGSSKVLLSNLAGDRRPLNDSELLRQSMLHPLMTLHIILAIHWHALLLFFKRIPHYKKEESAHLQTDIQNPHRSLNSGPKGVAQ